MVVADRLLSLGAEVRAADPNVLEVDRRVMRVDATPEEVAAADAVVVLTDHHDFDFEMIRSRAATSSTPAVASARQRTSSRSDTFSTRGS